MRNVHFKQVAWGWALLYSFICLLADWAERRLDLAGKLTPLAMLLYTIVLVAFCFCTGTDHDIGLRIRRNLSLKSWLYALPLGLPVLLNLAQGTGFGFAWLSTLSLVCASICEEIFFRGFFIAVLKPRNKLTITLVSSALFGLYHLVNLPHTDFSYVIMQMIFAFSVGMAYSAYVLRFGHIWPCIIFHLLTNLTGSTSHALNSADVLLCILCSSLCIGYSLCLCFYQRLDLRRTQQ